MVFWIFFISVVICPANYKCMLQMLSVDSMCANCIKAYRQRKLLKCALMCKLFVFVVKCKRLNVNYRLTTYFLI